MSCVVFSFGFHSFFKVPAAERFMQLTNRIALLLWVVVSRSKKCFPRSRHSSIRGAVDIGCEDPGIIDSTQAIRKSEFLFCRSEVRSKKDRLTLRHSSSFGRCSVDSGL